MKKLSVFKKYFFSYIVIVIISVIFLLSIYNIFVKTKENEIRELNNSYLTQIKQLVDGQINSVNNIVNLMVLSPKVSTLYTINEELTSNDRLKISEGLKIIRLYSSGLDICNSINMQIFKPNMFFTSESVYFDNVDLYTNDHFGIDKESFGDVVNKNYQRKLSRISTLLSENTDKNVDKDYLYYLQSIPINSKSATVATVMVEINENKLLSYFENNDKKILGSFYILDSSNNVAVSNSEIEFPNEIVYSNLMNNKVINHKINDKNYVIYSTDSDILDIKYVIVVPESLFWSKAKKIRDSILTLILIFFIFTVFMSYFLASRNYMPVKNIAKKIIKDNANINYKNEYEIINQAIENTIQQEEEMERLLMQKEEIMKNQFLFKWIKGKITDEKIIKQQLEAHKIPLKGEKNILVGFKINDYSKFSKKEKTIDSEANLVKFIIRNIHTEVISSKLNCIATEIDDQLLYIVNIETKENYREMIEKLLHQAYIQVDRHFNIDFTTAVSNVHNSFSSISLAYMETNEALSYTKLLGNVEVIFYEDTLETPNIYKYPLKKEECIINNIKIGNNDEVKKIIKDILQITNNADLRIETVQLLYFDILSSLIKTISSDRESEILRNIFPMKKLMKSENIDEMNNILYEVVDKICLEKKQEKNSNKNIKNKIEKYILENYNDINLNVSSIGNHFEITPVYLSKLYKLETGQTILNYINDVRIERAKELLHATSLTISEISNEIGYAYTNTFIRIFKKLEGITPGQYRNLQNKK